MTIRKKLMYAALTTSLVLALVVSMLLIADLALHRKYDDIAGLNRRGYRGPVVGRKRLGEYRVAVLGGSTVLGYGLFWHEAFPARLEQRLRMTDPRFSVVNLGYNNEGAYAMMKSLQEDFVGLQPDLTILYEGYNDLNGPPNTTAFRHASFVFRLTGYFPILPVIAGEKAMAWRTGDIRAAYRGERTAFRPDLAHRAGASALEASAAISKALDRQFAAAPRDPDASEPHKIAVYCDWMAGAVTAARQHGAAVLVVGQPRIAEKHTRQQRALHERIVAEFSHDARVAYVDLSEAVHLSDRELCWDGAHLTPKGNDIIAERLIAPILEMAQRQP